MAGLMMSYHNTIAGDGGNPFTMVQIVAAADLQTILHDVTILPVGSSGSNPPPPFGLYKQTTGGTMTDGSSNIVLDPNMPAITPQTGVFHTATVEPTTTSLYRKLGVHELGAGVWVPQGPVPKLLIPPGTRLGLVLLSTATISFTIGLVLEE